MMKLRPQKNGFTLVEVLIVIGILGIIVAFAIPFYQSFQVSSQMDNFTQEILQNLRRAQVRAMASESFSEFGVHFESNRFVIFRGSSYSPSDPFNEEVVLPDVFNISTGTSSDVVFARIIGTTTVETVTISTNFGESRTITINELGVAHAQ